MLQVDQVKDRLQAAFGGDREQLEVIFSERKNLLVDAPAGYGKTRTIVGRIAYLLAADVVPPPKKILVLTFSVNAAYKIRKDVAAQLPILLQGASGSPADASLRVFASNYHGFARSVLSKYGYLIHEKLRDLHLLRGIDDGSQTAMKETTIRLSSRETSFIADFCQAVKERNSGFIDQNSNDYLKLVSDKFLKFNYIPFNAILLFLSKLLTFNEVLTFYQRFYPVLIVDEFQDTNLLGWSILQQLIAEKTMLMFVGDHLQKIYDFIGAIDHLLDIAEKKYKLHRITLKTNHRFSDNAYLLALDKNLRSNAANLRSSRGEKVKLSVPTAEDQEEEASMICSRVEELMKEEPGGRAAILVKQRSRNTEVILGELRRRNIHYLDALFSDENEDYRAFHRKALAVFVSWLGSRNPVLSRRTSKALVTQIADLTQKDVPPEIHSTLLALTQCLFETVMEEYVFLPISEKNDFVKDVFENLALKQYLQNLKVPLTVTTVHGAKGLEWDYVLVADVERFTFPFYGSTCRLCEFKTRCNIDWARVPNGSEFEAAYLRELCVFYVAATRAKQSVYFFWSETGLKSDGTQGDNNMSCFLKLPGMNI